MAPNGYIYVAEIIWELGGRPQRAVIGYTPLGYRRGYWPLPSQVQVRGIAVDANGRIHVAQAGRILKLQR